MGASGDLVQLAHIALTLIGEGEVFYQGQLRPTAEVMNELKLTPPADAYPRGTVGNERHVGDDRYRHR